MLSLHFFMIRFIWRELGLMVICYHLNDSCLSVTYVIFIAEIFWAEIQMWEFFIMVIYVIVIFPSFTLVQRMSSVKW